jgi:hypothetical protein
MTNISPLSTLSFSLARLPTPNPSIVSTSTSLARSTIATSSTTVTLGQPHAIDPPTYAFPSLLLPQSASAVWESPAKDAIALRMRTNYASETLADRFKGVGEALLNRFKTDGEDFSQSVMQRAPASNPALERVMQSTLHAQTNNQITLSITTVSGVKVGVTLGSQADGLAVKIAVTGGTLTEAERSAIEKLSGAFQNAIDGLTANPPRLDLAGLTQYDASVLSSVALHANVLLDDRGAPSNLKIDKGGMQTVDFVADRQQRTVTSSGPAGTVKIHVDLANTAIIGSAKQQAQALARYLQQFDSASTRGHGDASLMSMFEDAFAEMNSHYGMTTAPLTTLSNSLRLNDVDHSVLTGLADFDASITQAATSSNPMRLNELDALSYTVSQTTNISGHNQLDRSISQQQRSHLSASYHRSLIPGVALKLDTSPQSQNYYYEQINDDANSQAVLAYNQGMLVQASLEQSTGQSTHEIKFVKGQVVADITTPFQASRSRDLLALLKPLEQNEDSKSPQDIHRRQTVLSAVSDLVLLQADPSQLRH